MERLSFIKVTTLAQFDIEVLEQLGGLKGKTRDLAAMIPDEGKLQKLEDYFCRVLRRQIRFQMHIWVSQGMHAASIETAVTPETLNESPEECRQIVVCVHAAK